VHVALAQNICPYLTLRRARRFLPARRFLFERKVNACVNGYDPTEWFFPGSAEVDGTVTGAMKAGMEAYKI
jgi:hypothetical protein